jgi:signal transduction histidine kinase
MAANSSQPIEATDQQIYLRALAHEMKTPLTVMQGYLEAMLGDLMSPVRTQQHIGRMAQELARLTAVVDDMYLRVRVESAPLTLRPVPLDVLAIVDYALNDAGAAFCGRDFSADAPVKLPLMTVDQNMLHVLLRTLLYNGARRRISDEPVTLRIAIRGEGLEFCVDDELAPLPNDVVERLFEARPDLPHDLQLPQFGLGLRLYAARRVAQQMGGELGLVPGLAAGEGNRYRLWLPLRPPAGGAALA